MSIVPPNSSVVPVEYCKVGRRGPKNILVIKTDRFPSRFDVSLTRVNGVNDNPAN